MNLQSILHARWFPTVTKPIASGLVAMGIVYGLRAVGVTSFTPWEINNAVTPVVGLLVAAIVTKPPPASPQPTATDQMKQLAVQVAHEELAKNPDLIRQLAGAAFKDVLAVEQTQASPSMKPLIDAMLKPAAPPTAVQAEEQQGFVR